MSNINFAPYYNGIWYIIHTLALYATTNELKHNYIITINSIAKNFPCETCKPDFEKFIKTHSLISYKHDKETGYFKWSWELHNMVNKKLNKSLVSYEDALDYYKTFNCQNCVVKHDNKLFLKPIEDYSNDFNLISR